MAEQPATSLDYSDDGPQTTYEGQRWTVELEVYIPGDLTEQQVEEGLVWALGGGSIANDHPLIDGDFRNVEVYRARPSGRHKFVDWSAKDAEGVRHGRGRFETGSVARVAA